MHSHAPWLLSALVTIASMTAIASADEPTKVSQRWGVLIGVDDYAYANDLDFCGADQHALFEQLKKSGFPADNVFLLHTKADDAKYLPSRGNIERQLNLVFQLAEENDLLFVGFSGHGVHIDGKSYLCPSDAVLDDPKTLIALDDVYQRLQQCAAPFKVVIVDACRNDPNPGGKRSFEADTGTKALAESLKKLELPEGVVLLNSCAPGEISWEEKEFGHGVFMHFVLEGLAGAADSSGDRAVSLNELSEYVGPKTKVYVARKFGYPQRPFFKGDLSTQALSYALLPVPSGVAPKQMNQAEVVRTNDPPPPVAPPPPTMLTSPFTEAQAREQQQSWARSLNGEVRPRNSIGMQLTLIPPGEFLMGNDDAQATIQGLFPKYPHEDYDAASPQHRVRITKPFYLGTYEVTLGQFLSFYHDASYRVDAERDGQGGEGWDGSKLARRRDFVPWAWGFQGQTNDHPAVNLSWNDAAEFCNWLSRKEGKRYRLPTEAEWEYACRAGTTTRYYNGGDPDQISQIANIGDATAHDVLGFTDTIRTYDGHAFTAKGGQFAPNAFGIYDMIGNTKEWCGDWEDKQYYRKSPLDDPRGPASGTQRILRGGGWSYQAGWSRSAARVADFPTHRCGCDGFRVVLEP